MFFRLTLLSLCVVAPVLAAPAFAQDKAQKFVPNELIIGYGTPEERNQAIDELKTQNRKTRSLNAQKLEAQPLGDTSLKLRIERPKTRGIKGTDELDGLQDAAKTIKKNNPQVKYAHPNWILGVNPPKPDPNQKPEPKPDNQPQNPGVQPQNRMLKPQSAPLPGMPNDTIFVRGLHWHYQPLPMGMNAVGAWKQQKGSRDIVVAVLDTGILPDHPDIKGSSNLLPGYNFVSGNGEKRGPDATDPGDACEANEKSSWHGSHVAGTIGAAGSDNALDIAGVNWNVSVLPVRVLGKCGGSIADIAAAVRWAAGLKADGVAEKNDHPAHVINMSLGGPGVCTPENVGVLIDALQAARAAGSVIVVSAGNEHKDIKDAYPAGCKGVISVAANDKLGHLAWYSNFGDVTVMAPGGDTRGKDETGTKPGVWSVVKPGEDAPEGVEPMQGTSMAAPHVAAALALALASHPEWRGKPDVIEQKLRSCVVKPAADACSKPCGVGQLDAEKLLSCP